MILIIINFLLILKYQSDQSVSISESELDNIDLDDGPENPASENAFPN